ncbi:hypothetical protein IKE82_02200 [Candidatus Saccharibacteria bacterium]|nr:hypothetical protein [Candidatus Saccharibacteria bacterium]
MIILTDLSEVLIRGLVGLEDKIEYAYGYEAAQQYWKRKNAMSEKLEDLLRGCITEDKFWEDFLSTENWPFGVSEIKALFSKNLAEEIHGTYDLYTNIVKYPRRINEAQTSKDRINGRPAIWILSDHIAERKLELELLHPEIFNLAAQVTWSFDEVALKSDPGYFHRFIKRNYFDPEELFFIDNCIDNIHAAAKAKIPHAWFQNYRQLQYVMRRHGFWFGQPNQNQLIHS